MPLERMHPQLGQHVQFPAHAPDARHIRTGDEDEIRGLVQGGKGVVRQAGGGVHYNIAVLAGQLAEQVGNVLAGQSLGGVGGVRGAECIETTGMGAQERLEHHGVPPRGTVYGVGHRVFSGDGECAGNVAELQIQIHQNCAVRR
ncbi:hypothetical protein BJQ89_01708 [Arthrobacter sp. ES1]|nr:hypothetical protein [Arthrobacter sp. ES1]